MTHSELVEVAYNWLLKSARCSFAFKELTTYTLEQPDAIGWKNGYSVLIECKTSRSDFFADQKKDFRKHEYLGVGKYRFYMAPEGLLTIRDIPEKWGFLVVDEKCKVKKILAPEGNIWCNWPTFKTHTPSEITMLCSALRRVHKNNDLEKIF